MCFHISRIRELFQAIYIRGTMYLFAIMFLLRTVQQLTR